MIAGQKTVFLLVGPKGSGKSHIGRLFQQKYGIPFIVVEDWVKHLIPENPITDDYVKKVFDIICKGIIDQLKTKYQVIFESTGISDHFLSMYKSLSLKYNLVLIKVEANPETCIRRIEQRNAEDHIYFSEPEIRRINNEAIKVKLPFNAILSNDNPAPGQLEKVIDKIIEAFPSNQQ